jgi:hypothetical protein
MPLKVLFFHPGVFSSTYTAMYMENIPWAYWIWPERWWTMPDQVEVRGNPDGRPKQFWRANRLSELGIGAKDQSNYLVAGHFRSFSQDSWSIEVLLTNSYLVKRMIRGLRNEMFLTYSQTLNGYVSYHTWMMMAYDNCKRLSVRLYALSGPSFGKQNWCCGMNQTHC